MRPIRVVAIGDADPALLAQLAGALADAFPADTRRGGFTIDPAFAFHPERRQYHSTMILERLARIANPAEYTVGLTRHDLFMPILTFVFGEAQLGGSCAIISTHRLRQEFYGLPPDQSLLVERMMKEGIHEMGHVAGLTHCDDYECVMSASHSVEWIDVKGGTLCNGCRSTVLV